MIGIFVVTLIGEKDGNLHIATHAHMWYICIYVSVPYVHNPESAQTILRTQLKRGNGRLGKPTIVSLNSYDEEKGCRFEGQRKETWIYTWPAWLIAVKERMLEFYSD